MVEPWWGLSCLFGGWWNGTEVPLYVSLMMQGKFFIPNCKLPSRQIPTKKHQLPNPAVQLWPLWRTAVTRTRKSMVHRFGNVERSGKWGESWRVPSVFESIGATEPWGHRVQCPQPPGFGSQRQKTCRGMFFMVLQRRKVGDPPFS